jgi:hypothetical protein
MAFGTHLHGRDAQVIVLEGTHAWRGRVVSPAGHVLAEGDAADRDAAEQSAEDEACAVHPPIPHLMDEMLLTLAV